MGAPNSVFHDSRLRRLAVATTVAAIAAVSLSTQGYSQGSSQPAHVTKGAAPASGRSNAKAVTSVSETVNYQRDVHAIFAGHCLTCHNAEKRSGGLSLGTYNDIMTGGKGGAAIKPGSSGQSLLVRRIMGEVAPAMPLGGDPLSSSEIATLRTWIDEGARATPTSAIGKARWDPPLALIQPAIPAATWANWTTPLDRFTSAYLARQGVPQPTPVDQAEFARRAYLDIWGLLPTPEQIREFIASKDAAKRGKLVASLMDNPARYSENWITWWNDLLRNDEGVAYISEIAQRKSLTPWLLDALQSNKPYNQMVKELLNPTVASDPDGFLIGVNWRGTTSASQTPAMQASQNAAQIFVGINFKCNSCHDSFISKWKLKDAYALAAYFSAEEKLQLYRCDVAQPDQFATAAYMYPELNRPLPSASVQDRRAAVAAIFTDSRNGRMPRTFVNRIWEKLMGHGIVDDVDDMDGEPWSPELLDYLSSDFVKSGYDIKHLISTIVASKTYQTQAVARPNGPPKKYRFRGPELRRLTAEQFADAIASVTGDWHVARPRPPAVVAAVGGTAGGVAPVIAGPGRANAVGTAPVGNAAGAAANSPGLTLAADGTKLFGVFSGAPIDTRENLAINLRLARNGALNGPIGLNGPLGIIGLIGLSGLLTPNGATPPAQNVTNGTALGGRGAPLAPPSVAGGNYAREWKIAGSSLTRALGRPIRDQVYSTRETQATSMQAIELVNGETLNHWLWRGAQKMLGELPAEPASLFSRQVAGAGRAPNAATAGSLANSTAGAGAAQANATGAPVILTPAPPPPIPFNIDISKSQKLYLIVEDNLSTAPDKAAPIWLKAFLTAADGAKTPLASLRPMDANGLREDSSLIIPQGSEAPVTDALRVKFPSVLVYDISNRGFTKFEGIPTFENRALIQGEGVTGRFFVFDQKPSIDRLAPPTGETPLPPEPVLKTSAEAVNRVYWYLLGRAPSVAERQVAVAALRDPAHPNRPSVAGLADLLWSVMMSPEFQFIR